MYYRNKQQGVVLVIAMVGLLAISLAGVALLRTVDTSNVVSGNVAFNEAANQIADIGAEDAYININKLLDPNGCRFNLALCPTNATGQSFFYANVATIDPNTRLPTPTGGLFWSDPLTVMLPGDTTASYSVKYIVERMCGAVITGVAGDDTADFTVPPTFAKCRASPLDVNLSSTSSGGSISIACIPSTSTATTCTNKALQNNQIETTCTTDTTTTICEPQPATTVTASIPGSATTGKLYYRITVQVFGPRNTRALAQYFYPQEIPVY